MRSFTCITLLGYGSSAIVYSAVYKRTNQRVALKMIDLDMFERNQIDELRVSLCVCVCMHTMNHSLIVFNVERNSINGLIKTSQCTPRSWIIC